MLEIFFWVIIVIWIASSFVMFFRYYLPTKCLQDTYPRMIGMSLLAPPLVLVACFILLLCVDENM